MAGATIVAKKPVDRSPKNKERIEPGFRTIGVRVSPAYAEWLSNASRFDRVSIAAFIDKAVADRAKEIGFVEPAPERIP